VRYDFGVIDRVGITNGDEGVNNGVQKKPSACSRQMSGDRWGTVIGVEMVFTFAKTVFYR
jgi:hypothetical protein